MTGPMVQLISGIGFIHPIHFPDLVALDEVQLVLQALGTNDRSVRY